MGESLNYGDRNYGDSIPNRLNSSALACAKTYIDSVHCSRKLGPRSPVSPSTFLAVPNPPSSLPAVGRVVVRGDRQQTDELAVPVSRGPSRLGDPQRIHRRDSRGWRDADDLLPFQAVVRIDLAPRHAAQFVQRFQRGMSVGLGQREQVVLKYRVVQIEPDLGGRRRLSHSTAPEQLRRTRRSPDGIWPNPRPWRGLRRLGDFAANAHCPGSRSPSGSARRPAPAPRPRPAVRRIACRARFVHWRRSP